MESLGKLQSHAWLHAIFTDILMLLYNLKTFFIYP